MNDPVRAVDGKFEITVERSYAAAHDLEVLDPETPEGNPWHKGKLRGPTRRGGRPLKDVVTLPPAQLADGLEIFDPSSHTVEQVNAHLAAADDDERDRVLDLEAAGQNRKGVVEGPHAA